ncbi:hypothetical protein PseBG33_2645 [Pseudomonas synxantha BG33R]|uniref:hypothetical protein n=1 Tax=Pseudomonas synxantha TaxID=47883 RepID=UPI00025FF837|nr:hypothetical protein [Pseudomonas synxantha]EIK67186.1 hypothetical protein PseBG33_2645 [Pseudomonas synxantha BG33R]
MSKVRCKELEQDVGLGAFGARCLDDMVWKLAWEIRNLEREENSTTGPYQNEKEAEFAAFNCAISAWHILDWVWRTCNQEQKAKISPDGTFKSFKTAMAAECRSLLICQTLCNSTKHASPGRDLRLRCLCRFVLVDPDSNKMKFNLIVEAGGEEHLALDVFKQAGRFLFEKLIAWNLFEVFDEDDHLFK